MRFRNYTDLSDALVREVAAFVMPPGVTGSFSLKNCGNGPFRGRAYPENAGPYCVVSIGAAKWYPYRGQDKRKVREQWRRYRKGKAEPRTTHWYAGGVMTHTTTRMVKAGAPGNRKGYLPRPALGNRTEALVYVLAHELRHLWQGRVHRGRRVWGSRGQYSERDADAYAIHKLREWRRR
jgi:hypothetical protein